MVFVIDLDDTLLLYEIDRVYSDAKPNIKEIEISNKLYDEGNIIIIHTGRNWDKYVMTKNQLKKFGINHHELVMGKPQGVYIDVDSKKTLGEATNCY